MKAAVQTRYGPPEVVRIAEVDKPTARDHELLVKVHATTVNRTDCGFRAAKPFFSRFFTGLARPRARVLGSEFAGEVEAVGAGVSSFRVGDRVFGFTGFRFGAHAEYLTVAADSPVVTMSAELAYEEAAPSSEGAIYALTAIRAAKVQPGHDVLVNGATGAIGSASVQVCKHLGATVTAVCAGEHRQLVRDLGADRVIDYAAEDFTRDSQRYDMVHDAVGKSSFLRCRRLLKPGGIYVSSDGGRLNQNFLLLPVTPLLRGRTVRFRIPRPDQQMLEYFRELIESGAFRPLIDRRYQLEEIVEAYRYVESGRKLGNVVVTVTPWSS